MRVPSRRWMFALGLAACAAVALAADAFAPAGAKATLSVDYVYESSGKSGDKNDQREWRAKDTVSLVVDMAAQAPQPLPQLQPLEAGQTADLTKKRESFAAGTKKMAPVTASVEEILAKCGENEACIERETKKLGESMAGTQELETAKGAGKDMAAAGKMGPARYQVWRATAQKGTYSIDEAEKFVYSEPTYKATRDTTRAGSGPVPALAAAGKNAGPAIYAGVEFDAQKNTFALIFPPAGLLPYTQVVKSDDPHPSESSVSGKSQKQYVFRITADRNMSQSSGLVVPLKGGWRSQSGEQVVTMAGTGVEGGKLTIRWRFNAAP